MTIIEDPALDTGGGDDRVTVVLSPKASAVARKMCKQGKVTIPELMRRALGLLRTWMELPPGTELMVHRPDGTMETLLKWWDE